ncbi:hypothetical protein HMI54_003981 [Coelomomyces lativittatus]|nr:hypothetical protein HMI54_003981 [Coelomomyces lativittatus]KAJ1510024.1 hypothetical protein HMI55_007159 [Coelomomyces lativittatus]KAJ1514270.1 hypothetical protein HMI56_000801 [Coelomomyces lativittatus]
MSYKTLNRLVVSTFLLSIFVLHLDLILFLSFYTETQDEASSNSQLTETLTHLMLEAENCGLQSTEHPCTPFLADIPRPSSYHVLHTVENAPLAIVMITNDAQRPVFALSIKNKLAYVKHHGYSLIVVNPHLTDRLPQWSKMGAILNAFSLKHPLVWMLDVDTIITNFSIPIHRLPDAIPDRSRLIYIPRDCNNLNTGSWLLKNHPWTEFFLNQMHQAYGEWKLKEPSWCEQQVLIDFYSMFPTVKRRIQELPDWILNLYPPECPDSIPRPWKSGDFVLHFAGMMHDRVYDNLYLRYYNETESSISSNMALGNFNESYWFQLIHQFI